MKVNNGLNLTCQFVQQENISNNVTVLEFEFQEQRPPNIE